MVERHPARLVAEPNLDPPSVELKIVGSPRVQETDEPFYRVQLELSRELTLGEQDAVDGWPSPIRTPAGVVYVEKDRKGLTVIQTTIELVAEHRETFIGMVSKIAAEGEDCRTRALKARRKAGEIPGAPTLERARRRNLAAETRFD